LRNRFEWIGKKKVQNKKEHQISHGIKFAVVYGFFVQNLTNFGSSNLVLQLLKHIFTHIQK